MTDSTYLLELHASWFMLVSMLLETPLMQEELVQSGMTDLSYLGAACQDRDARANFFNSLFSG